MDYEIPAHFKIILDPLPNPESVIKTSHARFTVLTSRMIRMEWSPNGSFEDRASQAFWFRAQVAPQFKVKQSDQELIIETDALRLTYAPDQPFTSETLFIEMKETGKTWHYGDPDPDNLGGTARTVDGVDGATPLSLGLISRSGWSLVDDSQSLVFNKVGWLEPRDASEGQLDLYFLGYGHDYYGCLREFNRVGGAVPMIPRFVLGNWWSRYWEYSQEDLELLIKDFQAHEVPLSVCIIDMDWHLTKTGNKSSGWTGYTWNRDLFPNPERILEFLHDKGLKVALNLHPADGLHPHEEMYEEMSKAVGLDPAKQEPVEFDITNPRFVEAYFRILHHPQEARGIDFWWMDWQQGQRTRLSGLDPLWWLNHLHFLDLGRDGNRRSFIFSRWGGLGNHRYPIGFSGDSVVSWASLAFQPYFTATASNVNYGWWSHDIGGHMAGVEDSELYTRWVQLGAFLPVLRMHSTKNPYHERRPWGYDDETFAAARSALQLRHALIPYLYSMAWRYHQENIPPLVPMYYDYPEQEDAYACPNQYMFGSQLVAAPFISPKDDDTRLSRSVVWLPKGDWYNFFTGEYVSSGWQAVHGTLRDIPVFAKAGAIIPQGPMAGWDNIDPPVHLVLNVFPGADGAFDLYEDEGNTNAYLDEAYAITPMRQEWKDNQTKITIGPAQGKPSLLPEARRMDLVLRGVRAPAQVSVRLNGIDVEMDSQYHVETSTLRIEGMMITPTDWLEVTVSGKDDLMVQADPRLATMLRMLGAFRMQTGSKSDMANDLPQIVENPGLLARYLSALTSSQMRALMEVATGAGMDCTDSTGAPLIVAWNNLQNEDITLQFSLARQRHWWRYKDRNPWANGVMPRFQAFKPEVEFGELNPWVVQASYYGMNVTRFEGR